MLCEAFAINCKTILSILDPSEILCKNWGLRKVIYFSVYAAIAGALVVTQIYYDWWGTVVRILRADYGALGIILFLVEPFMVLLSILTNGVYPVPPKQVQQRPKMVNGKRKMVKVDIHRRRRKKNKDLAIVIACHNSRDIIPNTVEACLRHVKPQQIYIVDNGNSPEPTDDSREVLAKCSPKSNYIWNGYGNKTLAQYAGVMACKKYKYILVLDDDVILPENLDMGIDLIEGNTVGVVYPIRACHPERRYSLFVEWQSLEYQLTGYNKLMQHKSGTVQYPHGAASMWERGALKKALRDHDTVFYAEDAKLGFWAMRNGFDLKMKPEVVIYTESPHTILGEMPNFWTQRVRSWDMALHAYFWQYVKVFFFTAHTTLLGTLAMKLTQFYTVYSIFADWLRLPVIILSAGIIEFYIGFGLYLAAAMVVLYMWNMIAYWRRDDLRLSFLCIVTYPIYACIVLFTRFFGLLRAMFIYLPNYQRPPSIPEIEDEVVDSWNAVYLKQGYDVDDDDDDKSTASDNSEEGANGPREPVWLSEDPQFVEAMTTCSTTTGGDFLSAASPTPRALPSTMQKGPSQSSLSSKSLVGKDLCLVSTAPSQASTRKSQRDQRSSSTSRRGYPVPYDLEAQNHNPNVTRSRNDRRRVSAPVDTDSLTEGRISGGERRSNKSAIPVAVDNLMESRREVNAGSQRQQHHSYKSSSSKRGSVTNVERWQRSVDDHRRVSFARREDSDEESGVLRGEV